MVEQTLQAAGYEVTLAANGNQGLQVQCAKPASLVITDLLMPEKDGLETIVDFRRDFPKVPIIAISGRPSTEFFLYMAGRLGSVRTLEKPFRSGDLLAAVEETLQSNA
jgi:DNA-binding response OmpR family regulator